ncbi:uncharacterized protein LOC127876196 [Dreissena polymorpha]|uniref:Uncharacterized protein n=1 Tax=Dreissena polymorpha TaxID=45954 RepID=A0A9D4HA49_DREPO|nr:uncharacterized protein LOC127876196 [Dreissena polymorpha]KAH3829721.1 hypothetical protein DPMN_102949 [Dreissena polymorpha]
MLRTRTAQTDDALFRWARTEMKRELVMSQSTYAKIAGIQSEIGRVVITRVAGSELEYKRTLNMYRKDAACAVNNIRREQIKMRMKLARYVRKLKQTRIEHIKLIRDQRKHDEDRALLEALHLRLKFEAAAKTPEPEDKIPTILSNDDFSRPDDHDIAEDTLSQLSDTHMDFKGGPIYLQTTAHGSVEDLIREADDQLEDVHFKKSKHGNQKNRKPSVVFAPILPMINEDEKEVDEILEESEKQTVSQGVPDRFELKVWDDSMSVSSYGGRIKRKNDVSFSDIIKLKYSGVKNLFDLVHKLARKHGIQDVVEKVPDPRDNIVHRGATNDSFRLQAAVLYPMKYGYGAEEDAETSDRRISVSKSPAVSSIQEQDRASENGKDGVDYDLKAARLRRTSVESRRSLYLSGKHSLSVDSENPESLSDTSRTGSPRKLKSRDLSMPELVDKMSRIKIEQADRLSGSRRLENEMISNYNYLTPSYKPSSSKSSRSLPALKRDSEKENDRNVSWTQAFGLLRAIHSLEDIS